MQTETKYIELMVVNDHELVGVRLDSFNMLFLSVQLQHEGGNNVSAEKC